MKRSLSLPLSLACALSSAALIATATRPWGLGLLAAVGYVPAFAALVRQPSSRRGALVAAVASLGSSTVGYEAATGIAAWAYPAAVALAAVPFAIVGSVVARLPVSLLALPVLWCAAEFVPAQTVLLGAYALPLSAVGYSQADLPAVHLARLSSVSAVSLVVLAHNALVTGALTSVADWVRTGAPWPHPARRAVRSGMGMVVVYLIVAAAWGSAPRAPLQPGRESVSVRVVQPHLPLAHYVAAEVVPERRTAIIDQLVALSTSGDLKVDMTVWPEAAWPDEIGDDSLAEVASELASVGPVLFGAYGARAAPTNSAFWFDGSSVTRVYDKQRLVPFAESWLEPGYADPGPFRTLRGAMVAPFVCYDVIFPSTLRAAALAGADLLVVLTDDSFAGSSDVPVQHLRAARFRAVETGLPLVLASNSGPSAAFDLAARQVAASPLGSATSWEARLELRAASTPPTPYVRLGDTVGVFTCFVSLVAGAFACFKGGAPSSRLRPT